MGLRCHLLPFCYPGLLKRVVNSVAESKLRNGLLKHLEKNSKCFYLLPLNHQIVLSFGILTWKSHKPTVGKLDYVVTVGSVIFLTSCCCAVQKMC